MANDQRQIANLILLYHHVAPLKLVESRVDRNLYVASEDFENQISFLKDNYCILAMDELVDILSRKKHIEKPGIIIGFDDGHSDNFYHGYPIVKKAGIPIIIYLCTRWLMGEPWLWRLDIVELIHSGTNFSFEWQGHVYSFDSGSSKKQYEIYRQLASMFVVLDKSMQLQLLTTILESAGREVRMRSDEFLAWSQVQQMDRDPLITFGAHTVNHPFLANLSNDNVHLELEVSRSCIEAKIGHAIYHLAYPYGGSNAAGEREHIISREVGFHSSVTTIPGCCGPLSSNASTFGLPRLSVNGTWDQKQFVEEIQNCFGHEKR